MSFFLLKSSSYLLPQFVTIPDFTVRADKVRSLSRATIVNTYHFVTAEERSQWEEYTAENGPRYVEESIAIQEHDSRYENLTLEEPVYWDVIYDWDEFCKENPGEEGLRADGKQKVIVLSASHHASPDPGPFMPWWQAVPVNTAIDTPIYNWCVTLLISFLILSQILSIGTLCLLLIAK